MSITEVLIAIIGGFIAGIINTLAGNGSAITLTILTEVIGLPGNMANGTNRVGVLLQSWIGSWAFYRNGTLQVRRDLFIIIPMIIGALFGVFVAIWVSNDQFIQVFRYLMIFMLIVILFRPKRWLQPSDHQFIKNRWLLIPLFLALGFYGGFIQMGMGVFFLAIMVLGVRYSLVDSNAVKVFVIGAYTIVVLAIFHWQGLVDWKVGGILALGQMSGAYLTANFAANHPKANIWAHRLLVVVVLLAIFKLFELEQYLLPFFQSS